jgi:SAM-dependent methyltransferase
MRLPPWLDPLLQRVLRRRAARKFEAARQFIPAGARVIDLGCGEGYVAVLAQAAGARVVACDLRRSRRENLPFLVADATRLPVADDAFDVGLLAYVLHHAKDPDAVVREAVRTCRRVVVWESLATSRAGTALLTFLDRTSNSLRGVAEDPLHFDRAEGWIARFAAAGARLAHRRTLGRFIHRHDLFVFERDRADDHSTSVTTA